MKHMRTEPMHIKEVKVIDKVTCDLCGKEIKEFGNFEIEQIEISYHVGSNYPEGGSGEEMNVDMCADCYKKKLVPWLKTHAIVPIKFTDWGW